LFTLVLHEDTDSNKLVTCLIWSNMKAFTDSNKLVTCLL
jgi:hypothetical protein